MITVAEPERYGLAAAASILATAEFPDLEREEKQRVLDLAIGRCPPTCRSTRVCSAARPGRGSPRRAEFDLMLAGSRGYTALKRTALGSVAGQLVDSAACPVLVLPRGVGWIRSRSGADKAGRALAAH